MNELPPGHPGKWCDFMHCDDCDRCGTFYGKRLALVAADLGKGAFCSVLCPDCWHRRQYRAELEQRLKELTKPDAESWVPEARAIAEELLSLEN